MREIISPYHLIDLNRPTAAQHSQEEKFSIGEGLGSSGPARHAYADCDLSFEETGALQLGGRYRLEERIGSGGMGAVYKARHTYLKSTHAIKLFVPELVGSDSQFITRFRQEAIAAAAIRHPNVVPVTDFGVASGNLPFLVMDFIQGQTLDSFLSAEGKLQPEVALEIITAIAAGVSAAHKAGIIHRDLKPLNVMLQEGLPLRETVKVLDFGLAKIKSGELLGSFVQARTSGFMGSPFYMAPEQWSDAEPDARTDIYSLAVIFFQLLTGEVPFSGLSVPAIMRKHLVNNPPTLSSVLGGAVPSEVDEVVLRALAKKPEDRPASVTEFISALRVAFPCKSDGPSYVGKIGQTRPAAVEPLLASNMDLEEQRQFIREAQRRFYEKDLSDARIIPAISNEESAWPVGKREQAAMSSPKDSFHECAGWQTSPLVVSPESLGLNSTQAKRRSRMWHSPHKPVLFAISGVAASLVIFLGLALLLYFYISPKKFYQAPSIAREAPQASSQLVPLKVPAILPPQQRPADQKPRMITITGGTFLMGRNTVPPGSGAANNEWPAHLASVETFSMDRTEVTNEEFAEFVHSSGHHAPAAWDVTKPPAGEEQWPVTNVSLDDVRAFAEWRSRRDGVTYRLPTEEEWEYASRGGDSGYLYPWGKQWIDGVANVGSDSLQPVGSYPTNSARWDVVDLIGNAWEWTSSQASFYPGNRRTLPDKEKGWVVVRGGSFKSSSHSEEAITSTSRGWVPSSTRDPKLGFRLVRQGS